MADYGYISNAPQRMTLAELGSLCSRFPLTATLAKFGKDKAPAFIILYPAWLTELDHLWTEENLDRVKLLTRFKVLMEAMPYLDPDLVNDVRTLNGLSVLNAETNPWFVCNRVNTFGHLLAKLYAEKILGSEMKEKLVSIVRGLVDTYRTLLDETEWLSADGRSNALEKLDHIRLNILEPDGGYYDFSGLELIPASEGGTLFTSYLAVKAYLNEQENRYIGKPAKADIVWKAPNPLSANCFYDAFSNTVNLLPGFIFSILCTADSTEAEMLGGIGTVIAHEISHALDFAGSQCDAYGRGASILTDADREIFLDKVKAVEEYYNAITILPGTNCRGTFLRVENTADMAGMRAAAMLAKSLGLDLADFFCEYARIYAMTASPLMLEYLNTVDTHAFSYLRTNVNIQMTDEFYEAFGIKEGDGMYIRPEDRLRIWGK